MDTTTQKPLSEMSAQELEEILRAKKEAERKELAEKKAVYENERNDFVVTSITQAEDMAAQLEVFKRAMIEGLDEQRTRLEEYGKLRANSKGGFSIVSNDDQMRVTYSHRAIGGWDERASKAEDLLKEFLGDTVKKRDQDAHALITSLLEKNKEGKFEYSRIQTIYQHEDRFKDARWIEAIRLLKESYVISETRYDIYFQKRDAQGKWQTISLNFSSI